MQDKIEIIKQIVSHHPSLGVDKGWSSYTGGMADTGHWHWEKMVDVSIEDLSIFLRSLLKIDEQYARENEKRQTENARVMRMSENERTLHFKRVAAEENSKIKEFHKSIERRLIWGK